MEQLYDIKEFEGLYAITKSGKIWSYRRKGQFLKPILKKKGYLCVSLCKKGIKIQVSLHRMISESFIPNPEKLPAINHKNGIKTDNQIKNLEWVTPLQNMKHAWETGLINLSGENNGLSKLNNGQVLKIRAEYNKKNKVTQAVLGKRYGVSISVISEVLTRRSWKHI